MRLIVSSKQLLQYTSSAYVHKQIPFLFFKPGVEEKKDASEDTDLLDRGPGDDILVFCRSCMAIISNAGEKINVNGSHVHTFANPHGLVFDIGCYNAAPGCAYSQQASDEFTWFKGYSWRIAVCRACMAHLGWLFISGQSNFTGLSLEAIIEQPVKDSEH